MAGGHLVTQGTTKSHYIDSFAYIFWNILDFAQVG